MISYYDIKKTFFIISRYLFIKNNGADGVRRNINADDPITA